jgi:hypothetical protein
LLAGHGLLSFSRAKIEASCPMPRPPALMLDQDPG